MKVGVIWLAVLALAVAADTTASVSKSTEPKASDPKEPIASDPKEPKGSDPKDVSDPKSIEEVVAELPAGRVRGVRMTSRRGRSFEAYRGMKYAEPPLGELRFQPPRPITKYAAEVDARDDGPACPLPAPPGYPVSEDCLTINVYTPRTNGSEPLPVIFFIHPGGFYSMTGRSDLAGPHYLMDRDLVLVTINYRLAALGFLSTGDANAPGNNGMRDQVVALRWVQRNIRALGGDPKRVTIAGVSAGSFSVMYHMLSPMTKGLFHAGIAISGSPLGKEPIFRHQLALAQKQARLLGCPENDTTALVNCLKTKPWKELGDSYPKFFEIGFDPVSLWKPVVERDFGQERYLTEDPVLAVRAGRMHAVPLIVSQTTDEFAWFAYNALKNETAVNMFNADWEHYAPISFDLPARDVRQKLQRLTRQYLPNAPPLKNDEESRSGMGKLYVDSIEGFPVNRMATLMARHSPAPVFYYNFAYVGNHSHWVDPDTKKPVAAMHHDDMIYLFSLSYRFPRVELDTKDGEMVDKMTAIWYNFARYSDPNPRPDTPELGSLNWPPMTPTSRRYLRVDDQFSVKEKYNEDRYRLWEELYPLDPWPVED